jgi:hypothetical protein
MNNILLSFGISSSVYLLTYLLTPWGARGGAVVEALRYKLEGHGSIPDGVIGIFH